MAGCPKYLLSKLQKVQKNAARLIFITTRSAHLIPMLHSIHWLPIKLRIEYICFALISFLIRPPSTFQNFFTFTPFPGSSAPLQTHSVQNTILPNKVLWSALVPGSIYLEPITPCLCSVILSLSVLLSLS